MILEADNISFSYDENSPIFEGLSFKLKAGEIISIVGPSGTGKSTLLKCLAGISPIDEGSIRLEGEELIDPRDLLKPGHPEIALVNQLFELDDFFTVRENIANQLHHLPLAMRESFVEELLQVFELNDLADLQSRLISGGEKQRLTMACALAKEPKVLLLDEPFVHLDVHLHKKIGNYLRELAEIRQMAILLVTHNGVEALSWSDRIFMMREGKISSVYTPEKAYNQPKTLYEGRFFGELNSIYENGKQILFRPTQFSVNKTQERTTKVEISWKYMYFKGPYYAHYYASSNGREIVLYGGKELNQTSTIYV